MSKKIGIPRALMYYEYFPMWKTFFNELDTQVILSDKTNKKILDNGSEYCVSEACLPIKIYHGHVLNLLNKDIDYLFIPRIRSVYRKEYVCPKFTGLPEMIKFSINDLPEIIDTEIYLRKSRKQIKEAFYNCGLYFTSDKEKIRNARDKALKIHKDYIKDLEKGSTPLGILENEKHINQEKSLNIAIMGHVYNLYDNYVNMNIMKKLEKENIRIITPEMINKDLINNNANTLSKKMFWAFGRRQIGCAIHLFDNKEIDGIIYIMSFGCGVDSFVADLIERKALNEIKMPFLLMIIDEHTGEAGINTRLEAFIDMIKWRKNENNLSSYR